jgi:hypothetical protein
MIKVTAKDARRTEQLTPGWRDGECTDFHEAVAGTDGSKLSVFGIEVEENGLKFPLKPYQISEKAVSMGKAFFIACGFPEAEWDKLVKGEAPDAEIDERNCVSKKFRVFVKNTEYGGRISNEASDFLPLDKK